MDLFLPILGGTIFVGLMFGVFKKDGYNHNKYIIIKSLQSLFVK